MRIRRIPYAAQKELYVRYKGRDCGLYEPDFICFDKIIIEIKSVEKIHPKHEAQLVNYLRMTGFRLGLLVNFSVYPKVDIRRRVV